MAKTKVKLEAGKRKRTRKDKPEVVAARIERLKTDPKFIANRQPGMESPNPSGANQHTAPYGAKLISEAAKVYLQDRAPLEMTARLGLEPSATFADVIARNQMILAAVGGVSAVEFVHTVTEGKPAETHNHNGVVFPPPCTIVIRSKEKK